MEKTESNQKFRKIGYVKSYKIGKNMCFRNWFNTLPQQAVSGAFCNADSFARQNGWRQ